MSNTPFITRAFVTATTLCLTAAPMTAQASTCSYLSAAESNVETKLVQLLLDEPGASIVLGLCGAVGNETYVKTENAEEALLTFSGCAIIGCTMAGFKNCMNVTEKGFLLGLEAMIISEQKKSRRCRS